MAVAAQQEQEVKSLIDRNPVQIFTKSYCPHCKNVKRLFDTLNIPYHFTDLDLVPHGDSMQNYLKDLTGQKTVPNVFINKQHIGGEDATMDLHRANKLISLIKSGVSEEDRRLPLNHNPIA